MPSTAVISASRIASLASKLKPVVLSSDSTDISTASNVISTQNNSSATVPCLPLNLSITATSDKSTVLKPPPHIVNMMKGSSTGSTFILDTHSSGIPSPNPSVLSMEDNNNNNNNNNNVITNNNNHVGANLTGLTAEQLAALKPRKKSECPVCGIILSPKTNVNVHLRTHSGVRPYECVLCLNRFRQKAHLMKHFRCSHNQKQPPFICLFCSIETATSNDLYRHITDQHVKETDELRPSLLAARSDAADAAKEAQMKEEQQKLQQQQQLQQQQLEAEQQAAIIRAAEPEPEPMVQEEPTYEPITEDFLFEDQVISPCYVVLPYVSEEEVEAAGSSQLVSLIFIIFNAA